METTEAIPADHQDHRTSETCEREASDDSPTRLSSSGTGTRRIGEAGEAFLFDEIRYLFYISNDDKSVTSEQIVFSCNKRCDQENLTQAPQLGGKSLAAKIFCCVFGIVFS